METLDYKVSRPARNYIGLGVAAAALSVMTACGPAPTYTRVCVDDKTVVAGDENCERQHSGINPLLYHWYFLNNSRPGYRYLPGTRLTGGSFEEPHSAYRTTKGAVVKPHTETHETPHTPYKATPAPRVVPRTTPRPTYRPSTRPIIRPHFTPHR